MHVINKFNRAENIKLAMEGSSGSNTAAKRERMKANSHRREVDEASSVCCYCLEK